MSADAGLGVFFFFRAHGCIRDGRVTGVQTCALPISAGLFIAQHANVLIALWDGDGSAMRPGGPAEVVAFKRRGIPLDILGSARASLDASEIGPVIHVVTPRQRVTSAAEAVSVRRWGHAVIGRCLGAW